MRIFWLLLPSLVFSFEHTSYFAGYQFSHLDLKSESGEKKQGNIQGVDIGVIHQNKRLFFSLDFSLAKGSVFGKDFNRAAERLHYLQIDNENVFGFVVLPNSIRILPYLGLGFFLKSEVPFYPMDYCSIVYSFTIPLGLRWNYQWNRLLFSMVDIQTQYKLAGKWFIIGHPLFTDSSANLAYRDVLRCKLNLIWKWAKKRGISLGIFYKQLTIKQKHMIVFFEKQEIKQCGFTLLYYSYF